MVLRLCSTGLQSQLLRNVLQMKTCGSKAAINTLSKIGNRDIVGFGYNGSYGYMDRLDFPFPAVRFREPNNEINALREKECGSWKKLTVEEKKMLYRYSFCQTFAEIKAPVGDWKCMIAVLFCTFTLAYLYQCWGHTFVTTEFPDTFREERKVAQLRRMIDLEVNPIEGLCSKWDYDKKRWK